MNDDGRCILEGIVTTHCVDGRVNVSPMGPVCDPTMRTLTLRPFRTSTTFSNLQRTGVGVFHVTDDVEMLAHAAVGELDPLPALMPAGVIDGSILRDACRWYAFRVVQWQQTGPRAEVRCDVVGAGILRQFFGFNRAKHAVLEAAILATRLSILDRQQILSEFERLAILVEKTAGAAERRAFDFLQAFVAGR